MSNDKGILFLTLSLWYLLLSAPKLISKELYDGHTYHDKLVGFVQESDTIYMYT